jgi:magnesium transporter
MLRTRFLDRATQRVRIWDDPSTIDELLARSDDVVWVDILAPTEADYDRLRDEFGFHALAIEDCRQPHARPKLVEHRSYYFIVLYEVAIVDGELQLHELNLFLGSNYLVSVHSQPLRAIDTAARLWPEWTDVANGCAGLLAYLMIDAVVDDYMPLLDELSDRLDDLEDDIFRKFRPEVFREIFVVKKQLLFLRRSVAPLRDVFNVLLRREQPMFPREVHLYFQDVFDHLIRVTDMIDTLREMLGSTMDAYLSASGNRMNVVMKRLTSVATILMSVTLISSVYGMNFTFMPELGWRYGYVFALSSMLFVGLGLYLYLRWIRWL